MVDKGSGVEPGLGLVSRPFLWVIMKSLKMIGRGRLVSPVATPRRVGVRRDVPLPIRSHLDESLQGEKTPGPGIGGVSLPAGA